MNTENVVEFIKRGLNYEPTAKTYRSNGRLFLALCVLAIPGLLFGGGYRTISICLIFCNIMTCVILYILSGTPEKTINRLAMNLLACSVSGVNCSLCSIMFYSFYYEPDVIMWLLFLPSIFLAFIWCIKWLNLIKRKTSISKSKIGVGKIGVGLTTIGLAGVSLGKALSHNFSNGQTVVLIIVCFMIVATLPLSVVPQEIMRIYYFYKLKKSGIDENVFIKTE